MFHKMYRYCDRNPNTHLVGVTKKQCLANFIDIFGSDNLTVIADNCIRQLELDCEIIPTKLGNSGALKKAFELAMTLPDDDIVYLVEDDFLHLQGAKELLQEGLERVDYATLYFHPDKLQPGPNPYIGALGEQCNVFSTKSSIWKTTNSTVQTFAAKVKTLKDDKEILYKYNFNGPTPDSFKTFIELRDKGRTLAHPIPGYSTHCHPPWLAPFVDWKEITNA